MPAYYKKAEDHDPGAYDILAGLVKRYRSDLEGCGAQITILFAFSLKAGKPAIKHRGQSVDGSAEVNSLKDRVQGKGDATITLNGDTWTAKTAKRKTALVHHELCHIGVHVDGDGMPKHDDLGRPELRGVFGDWENDGFYEIARLYGDDAPEVRYLNGVQRTIAERQLLPLSDPLDQAG